MTDRILAAFTILAYIAYRFYRVSKTLEEISEKIAPKSKPELEGPVYDVPAETAVSGPTPAALMPQSVIQSVKLSDSKSESDQNEKSDSNLTIKSHKSLEKAALSDSNCHSDTLPESNLTSSEKSEPTPDLFITPDYRLVVVKGAEVKASPTQARVIARLWEYLQKGISKVHQDTLLEGLGIYSTKLKDVFKKSPLWKTLVVQAGNGFYRLNIS